MQKDAYVFWEWVQRKMEAKGIPSFRELERRTGMANGVINSRKNDLKFPTVEMAEGLCHALHVSWITLWEKAGFIDPVNASQLTGIDAEIYQVIQNADLEFKNAVLDTINVWLAWREKNEPRS
jgi:transcriptional regulator with XRE-family HTH domain